MTQTLSALKAASLAGSDQWQPSFFRLSHEADRLRLADVLASPGLAVHDTVVSQLKELVKALAPSVKFTPDELAAEVLRHVGTGEMDHYGVWVHYPWSNRLVHLLDESEFVLVRTDRNRNKITREEQAVLAKKRIGVIGLSVGQSIALTMAMERGFGEIRLADFDTLDLSNLNRIRSGVHHLGLKKVVNVAREIMEIDPYLRVTLFPEGITRDNIARFCTEGGKLDILVDECDSVDVKVFCRQTSKALGIPVVMDTSDRGMIDVERFDLEPEREIFHGLLGAFDLEVMDLSDPKFRMSVALAISGGFENLSERMAISLPEIGRSLTTWPQLASAVVQGGGNTTEVARKILLGQFNTSGRWHIDLEDLLVKASAHGAAPAIQHKKLMA
ncbi:MAG: ThiF family adenylyltransferase [Flavobacteriales bacterium]